MNKHLLLQSGRKMNSDPNPYVQITVGQKMYESKVRIRKVYNADWCFKAFMCLVPSYVSKIICEQYYNHPCCYTSTPAEGYLIYFNTSLDTSQVLMTVMVLILFQVLILD